MRFFPIFSLVLLTGAVSFLSALEKVKVHEVNDISDVTPLLLLKHAVIKIKKDNTTITSEYMLDMVSNPNFEGLSDIESQLPQTDDARKYKFVQSDFHHARMETTESEWEPLEGCIDNRYCETLTTIQRNYYLVKMLTLTPRYFFSLFGVGLEFAPSITIFHLNEEIVVCNVQPGQMLQLHRKLTTIKLERLKQRKVLIVKKSWWGKMAVECGDWEDIDPLETNYKYTSKLACVTDPRLLSCTVDP